MNSPDPNKNKPRNWKANHLGTFLQKGSQKDATNNALVELSTQLSNGLFRDLHCTITIDREKRIISIKRWLDNVLLDEYNLVDISNVCSFPEAPQNKALFNIVTFTTQSKHKKEMVIETHIFHFDDMSLANYFASDIRSAIEACALLRSNSSPVKVLPTTNQRTSGKFDNFESIRQIEDITTKTERNLLLLNYCFDDIEFFIQHLKDQEDARKQLASSKGKSTDRFLEGKAKPTTLVAYNACIQKIKFCFNLLSKLDGKIKNPGSRELSRLLMEHLIKIGIAYNVYHNSKLSKIKEPLLTQQTVILLQDSFTKEHFRIWTNWGHFWVKARERWAGYQEKYYPEFFNGYQIDIDELVSDGILSSSVERPKINSNNSEITELIHSEKPPIALPKPVDLSHSLNGSMSINQREEDFCRSVRLRNGRLYKVIRSFTASKDQELSLSEGEIIEVMESKPDRNWWLCANMLGQSGFSPNTVLEPFNFIDTGLNAFSSSQSQDVRSWPVSSSHSFKNAQTAPPKESLTVEKSLEESKRIREELKAKRTSAPSFGNANSRASFARPSAVLSKKHGQITINQDSTSDEVINWLKFKKFTEEDIERLKEFTGETIFLLSRDQMNRIVGVDVGARLDSFLKVQKSMSGFGTFSRKELDDILLQRKHRVDIDETF